MNATKIVSSVLFNYLGTIVVAVTGFITTPIILHHLGKGAFGAYALILAVIAYSSLLDLGTGLTVMRMVAERAHLSDRRELNAIASTGLLVYGAMGLCLMAVGVVAAPFLADAFHMTGSQHRDFTIAFMIVAATMGLTFPAGLYTGINQGFGHYRQQNLIVIAQALGGACASITVVLLGGGLIPLAAAGILAAGAGFVAKIVYAARVFGIVPSPFRFQRRMARVVLGVSGWMFLVNIASKVIWDTDNIVIGAVLGAVAVSHFTVALGPATAVRRMTDQFNTVSLTAASSLHAQGEFEGLRRLLTEGTRMVTIVVGPFFVLFALWGHEFLRLWVGPDLASSAPTLVVLVLGMLASSVQATATMVLLALGRQRTMAFVAIGEAVCNVTLSVILAKRLGIIGVALGTTIPTSITAFCFYLPYASRLLDLPLRRIARRLVLPVAVPGAAYVLVRFVLPRIQFETLPVFCVAGLALVVLCLVASVLLDAEERGTYLGVARSFGQRMLRAQ